MLSKFEEEQQLNESKIYLCMKLYCCTTPSLPYIPLYEIVFIVALAHPSLPKKEGPFPQGRQRCSHLCNTKSDDDDDDDDEKDDVGNGDDIEDGVENDDGDDIDDDGDDGGECRQRCSHLCNTKSVPKKGEKPSQKGGLCLGLISILAFGLVI